jgi:methionine synthase I (cobalamin-dependent)
VVVTSPTAGARERLRELLDERIVVLDGPWGTMLQGAGLTAADYRGERLRDHPRDVTGDPDLLNLTRPDIVREVHRQYLAAGADIITTNTFTATSIGQADYGLQPLVREMNLRGAQLARQAADEAGGRFVAGAIGPLNVTLSLSPRVEDPAYGRCRLMRSVPRTPSRWRRWPTGAWTSCWSRRSSTLSTPRRRLRPRVTSLGSCHCGSR